MDSLTIVQAAIPGATAELADEILWSRTAFPGKCSPRMLYEAAARLRRATANKIRLCDLCDNKAAPGRWSCVNCQQALARARESH